MNVINILLQYCVEINTFAQRNKFFHQFLFRKSFFVKALETYRNNIPIQYVNIIEFYLEHVIRNYIATILIQISSAIIS